VIKLESRVKIPVKPVNVVFQQEDESREEVVGRIKAEKHDPELVLIVVNFVKPENSFLMRNLNVDT
jgi:hypothetical protein